MHFWSKNILNDISVADSIALELNEIVDSLFWIHNYFEYAIDKTPNVIIENNETYDVEKIYPLIYILTDNIVIQLHKFIKISSKLHFIEKTTFSNSELLITLQDLREIILKNKEKVKLWRNEVAHSEKQAKHYEPVFKKDPDYPDSIKNFILQSRLLVHYIIIFFHELPAESSNVSQLRKAINNQTREISLKEWWPEMLEQEKKILVDTNNKLIKNGFSKLPIENAQNSFKSIF